MTDPIEPESDAALSPTVASSLTTMAPSSAPSVPAAPATVFVAPSVHAPSERVGRHEERSRRIASSVFRPYARAPIVSAAVALGSLVISTILVRRSAADDEFYFSNALRWAYGLLAPERTQWAAPQPTGVGPRVTVIVLVATALAVLVWAVATASLPRARNLAGSVLLLGLVAIPNLYNVPVLFGEPWRADLDELRLRVTLALMTALPCALARVLLVEKIWTGGQLPAPLLSLLVSVPGAIVPLLMYVPMTITVFGIDERGRGNPWWVLTSGQEDLIVALDYVGKVGLVLLLLVVTVNQARLIATERDQAVAAGIG